MDKDLLEKHKNDPAWAEVIRLYSGLFDTQDEREDFILGLAETDVLLAAECKTSSVEEEEDIFKQLSDLCKQNTKSIEIEKSIGCLMCLIELKNYNEIKLFFEAHKYRTKDENHKKLKTIIRKVIEDIDFEIFVFVCETLVDLGRSSLLCSLLSSINSLNFENYNEKKLAKLIKYLLKFRKEIISITSLMIIIDKFKIDISKYVDLSDFFYLLINKKVKKINLFAFKLLVEYHKSIEHVPSEVIKKLVENKFFGVKFRTRITSKLEEKSLEELVELIKFRVNPSFISYFDKFCTINNCFPNVEKGMKLQSEITNIIPSRVFVKIQGEPRPASIYMGELTNKRIDNILDFEYNGVKLHIGQKLTAKVISIDEQGRINLSLKRVKQNEK